MKIAIVRKRYTFHGGAEGVSQSLLAELCRAGHEVHLFTMEWKENAGLPNLFFHKVPAIPWNSFLRDLSFAVAASRMLMREQYDVIQSHDKTIYQDVYRAGDGCHIEWLRQRWRRTGLLGKLSIVFNPYHWLILVIERIIFKMHRYHKIIAISEMVKKNIIEHYGVSPDEISVIYNGVDLVRFSPENRKLYRTGIRKQYGISDNDFVLLFAGSGFERKGVKYLIHAVESLDFPVSVLIVGKGSGSEFRDIVKNQKIIFCGPQRDIERYYAASDIFVFPTLYEPFGNVHLEALASGLPVITTKNSGAAEIIEQGVNGFVVESPEDYRAIAEKIRILLDGNTRESMSRKSRLLAEKFTFERYTDELMKLYNRIIEQKKNFPEG